LTYLIYILISATGGLLVGLIGTGSSLVIMPVLALTFPQILPGHDVLRLSAGTTMATMAVGAVAGAYSQFRAGHLDLKLLRLALLPYICGALTGPWISRYLPTEVLRFYLAVIILSIAIKMLLQYNRKPAPVRHYRDHPLDLSSVVGVVGIGSSVAGIASGIFTIPYLTRFALPLRTIIGTSTAGAAVYSAFGAIGYLSAGWSADDLPEHALGYIYLPAFTIMALVTFVFTPLGVWLARYTNELLLRRFFAIFLLVAAIAIIGI
jgi:uncharacterized membrane protein YfcA